MQGFDGKLRLDQLAFAIIVEAVSAAPNLNLRPPFFHYGDFGLFLGLIQHLQHIPQHRFHRPDNGDVDTDILGDRRGIYINMNDLGVGAELGHVAGHPIIKTGRRWRSAHRLMH